MHRKADVIRERLDELATAYADGAIDARQLREGSERLRIRLAEVEAEIAAAAADPSSPAFPARPTSSNAGPPYRWTAGARSSTS